MIIKKVFTENFEEHVQNYAEIDEEGALFIQFFKI